MGGPWAMANFACFRLDNLKTDSGPSLVLMPRFGPAYVQPENTRIYISFRPKKVPGQTVDKLRFSGRPQIVQVMSSDRVTRWQTKKNIDSRLRPAFVLLFFCGSGLKLGSKGGPKMDNIGPIRTNSGFDEDKTRNLKTKARQKQD